MTAPVRQPVPTSWLSGGCDHHGHRAALLANGELLSFAPAEEGAADLLGPVTGQKPVALAEFSSPPLRLQVVSFMRSGRLEDQTPKRWLEDFCSCRKNPVTSKMRVHEVSKDTLNCSMSSFRLKRIPLDMISNPYVLYL